MKITNFEISSDKSKLNLSITDAAGIISLRLWDNNSYKDFTKLIDLSDKLTGATVENIEILPVDLSISKFDGIYFIEAEDINETSLEFEAVLNKYEECVLNKAILRDDCNDCNKELDKTLQNINTILVSLKYAIELRYINEMLNLLSTLDEYCTNDCETCGEVVDISAYENNNPDTIYIILDGESLD